MNALHSCCTHAFNVCKRERKKKSNNKTIMHKINIDACMFAWKCMRSAHARYSFAHCWAIASPRNSLHATNRMGNLNSSAREKRVCELFSRVGDTNQCSSAFQTNALRFEHKIYLQPGLIWFSIF